MAAVFHPDLVEELNNKNSSDGHHVGVANESAWNSIIVMTMRCILRAGKAREPVCICLSARCGEAVRMKIIIVEDEKSIRNGLVKMLPKLDPEYEVVGSAKDGLEGYQQILAEQPDLVIMDIEMPEMDGLTMLEKLRRPDLPERQWY